MCTVPSCGPGYRGHYHNKDTCKCMTPIFKEGAFSGAVITKRVFGTGEKWDFTHRTGLLVTKCITNLYSNFC